MPRSRPFFRRFLLPLAALSLMLVSACTTTRTQTASADGVYDPIEEANRQVFAVNDGVDILILNPVSDIYTGVVPAGVRRSVTNFLRHLNSPLIFANQLLQGDVDGAVVVLQRAFLNTTLGIGGLFDAAADQGYPYEPEDFGQTLAVWGVGEGPYLMLPLLGPSNARDTVGTIVDIAANPLGIYFTVADLNRIAAARTALTVVDGRSRADGVVEDLRANSSDFYASIRSAYKQQRDAAIADGDVVQPQIEIVTE